MKRILMVAILFIFSSNVQASKNVPLKPKAHVHIKDKWNFVSTIIKRCRNNKGKIGKCYDSSRIVAGTDTNSTFTQSIKGTVKFSNNLKGTMKSHTLLVLTFLQGTQKTITKSIKDTYKFKVFKKKGKLYLKTETLTGTLRLNTWILTVKKRKKKTRLTMKTIIKTTCIFNGLQQACFEIATKTYER